MSEQPGSRAYMHDEESIERRAAERAQKDAAARFAKLNPDRPSGTASNLVKFQAGGSD